MSRDKGDSSVAAVSTVIPNAIRKSLLLCLGIVAVYFLAAFVTLGRYGVEKALTAFAMPVGLLWLWLTERVVMNWINGASRVTCSLQGTIWLLVTLSSTAPVPDALMSMLEAQVTDDFDPQADQPLDWLVVFGGGTKLGPRRAEAAGAGDRVLYAAELFLQGNAEHLITTGDDCCEHTQEIWQKLNIPRSAITTIPGANTFQEIQGLKLLLEKNPQQRIGVLSSAYHLPRIQRLAKSAGLDDLISVAASHQSPTQEYTVLDFIPSASSLARFSDAYKEWLARLVGR